MTIGYLRSREEYSPVELVSQAEPAEQAGFEALWISDHFRPWNDAPGQSPFVCSSPRGAAATRRPAQKDATSSTPTRCCAG
jgi:alkanesulfonate monooxygenase SsuD/methylene tetrahydromethanopterin reductase-like flavin-dependent oxidoreductase (luciferase family)